MPFPDLMAPFVPNEPSAIRTVRDVEDIYRWAVELRRELDRFLTEVHRNAATKSLVGTRAETTVIDGFSLLVEDAIICLSSATAVTSDGTTGLQNGTDGQWVQLINAGTSAITLQHGANLYFQSQLDKTLNTYESVYLVWSGTQWVEFLPGIIGVGVRTIIVSDDEPATPAPQTGDLWIDSNDTSVVAGTAPNTVTLSETGILLEGTATVWDDLRVIPSSFDFPGVSDPVIGTWQPGGSGRSFRVWVFDQGDVGFFSVQLPHGYREGSDIHVHVHWTPRDRGVSEGTATVAWKLDYSWANREGVFGASVTADMTDACQSTDHQHLMSPEVTIDGHTAPKAISSMLMCAIYRDAGDTWSGSGATQAPALLEVDFHFEMDALGSNTATSKT